MWSIVLLKHAAGLGSHRRAWTRIVAAEKLELEWLQTQKRQQVAVRLCGLRKKRLTVQDVYLGTREKVKDPLKLLSVVTTTVI